ncbi:MAG TPA: DUF5682 family protein [Candidatus Xenobia bacterium]|jgi:hypothetical protein
MKVVGVRHHSPACARLVATTLREVRPRHVLIEGPADFNERLGELYLPHRLPIAIFSYYHSETHAHASWSPFCDYSPEWVALTVGREIGAEVRFIDLPAWHPSLAEVENRYADRGRYSDHVQTLCRHFGVEGVDSLWDHLFEQPMPAQDLALRLREYFTGVRESEPPAPHDLPREDFMARHMAYAGDDSVVICGGYHAPVLERRWRDQPSDPPTYAIDSTARQGSYLVSYSFHRLDAFTGYQSGMPSPQWYQAMWEGLSPESVGWEAIRRLRRLGQPVSSADALAVATTMLGLQALRGHQAPARTDVLDALAAGLIKEALDEPLPWSVRRRLRQGTHPVLVEMVAAFSGDRTGELAPDTPRPPLLSDVQNLLVEHDLLPPRTVSLTLTSATDRIRSRVLHRLLLLDIPGYLRSQGPASAVEGELVERWKLELSRDAESALIEASAWGATLQMAACARIERALAEAEGNIETLASLLATMAFIGMETESEKVLDLIRTGVGQTQSFEALGRVLGNLLAVFRFDTLLGSAGSSALRTALTTGYERALWLLEGVGSDDQGGVVDGVVVLRDVLRHSRLDLDRTATLELMARRARSADVTPQLRGACIGFQIAMGDAVPIPMPVARDLGDFLGGLFALAREPLLEDERLLGEVDEQMHELAEESFLAILPSLRQAFSYFPPREKEAIAMTLVRRHGQDPATTRDLLRLKQAPAVLAEAMRVDAIVSDIARRYGLLDE